MPAVSDLRLTPLVDDFFKSLQLALGLVGRFAFSDPSFDRAINNLHASLSALLETRDQVVVHPKDRQVCVNGAPLPDSYVLQRLFGRLGCPSVRFDKGIEPKGLLRCLREIESLLIRELSPTVMKTTPREDLHYRWLPTEQQP